MRIILFLLFLSVMFSHAASGFSQETKLTLDLRSASIKEICREVEKRSDYIFVFSDEAEKISNKRVNVRVDSKNINELLEKILSPNGLDYTVLEKQIVVFEAKNKITPLEVEEIILEKSISTAKENDNWKGY